ncbi:HNH endonuclease [Candidatus Odyssella thessalonicensis]|uniref:HNH endonuclease n=1 Tax=Candidatus Odyssella thessalonicensis TaxID=84647 RepID=UPI0002FE3CD0|nr:HNH endonuclease [Candidatus Odyssella thessalonicensis]
MAWARASQGSKGSQAYRAANRNGLSSQSQRSEAANRLYSDMRAVANGGNTHRSAFSDLGARTAGTKFGTPERMSGEQWINRSTHASSMSSGSSGSSTSTRVGASSISANSTSVNGTAKQGTTKVPSTHPRVRTINKQRPLNHESAGKVYSLEKLSKKLRQKYPHSVPFTGTGHPDFSRYAIKKVDIKMTGKREADNKLANQAAGFSETPSGYTWHHHENGTTMQLVPRDLHNAIGHTGGVAIIKSKEKKND